MSSASKNPPAPVNSRFAICNLQFEMRVRGPLQNTNDLCESQIEGDYRFRRASSGMNWVRAGGAACSGAGPHDLQVPQEFLRLPRKDCTPWYATKLAHPSTASSTRRCWDQIG